MRILAQTPRFCIREFAATDEARYLALFDDKEVMVHLPKRTRQENQQIFRDNLKDYLEKSQLGRWGIFNNGDDDLIGICLLRPYMGNPDRVELGYVLAQKFWRKGIGGEMAQIMIAYVLTHTRIPEIIAVTTLGNIGSQKVLLKASLQRKENIFRDGDELAFFSLKRQS